VLEDEAKEYVTMSAAVTVESVRQALQNLESATKKSGRQQLRGPKPPAPDARKKRRRAAKAARRANR